MRSKEDETKTTGNDPAPSMVDRSSVAQLKQDADNLINDNDYVVNFLQHQKVFKGV